MKHSAIIQVIKNKSNLAFEMDRTTVISLFFFCASFTLAVCIRTQIELHYCNFLFWVLLIRINLLVYITDQDKANRTSLLAMCNFFRLQGKKTCAFYLDMRANVWAACARISR